MTENLFLGCATAFIGLGTLFVRFALPTPKGWTDDPYVAVMREGWFAPLMFGVVPLLASMAFLGAWHNESSHDHWDRDASSVTVARPVGAL